MRKGQLVGEFFPEHISEHELNQKINEDTIVEYSQAQ